MNFQPTLQDLEDALRPNFVWLTGGKLYETDPAMEVNNNTALVVFCGIAHQLGFSKEQMIEKLSLDEGECRRYLESYKKHIQKAVERRFSPVSEVPEEVDFTEKVYTKSGLVSNKLRLDHFMRWGVHPF